MTHSLDCVCQCCKPRACSFNSQRHDEGMEGSELGQVHEDVTQSGVSQVVLHAREPEVCNRGAATDQRGGVSLHLPSMRCSLSRAGEIRLAASSFMVGSGPAEKALSKGSIHKSAFVPARRSIRSCMERVHPSSG